MKRLSRRQGRRGWPLRLRPTRPRMTHWQERFSHRRQSRQAPPPVQQTRRLCPPTVTPRPSRGTPTPRPRPRTAPCSPAAATMPCCRSWPDGKDASTLQPGDVVTWTDDFGNQIGARTEKEWSDITEPVPPGDPADSIPGTNPQPSIPADPATPGDDRTDRERYAREIQAQFSAWKAANPTLCCELDPCTLTAQWMHESNWGRSGLARDARNLGGIKGQGPAGSYNAQTGEVYGGKHVVINADFRAYSSYTEFYADYARLVCTVERYKGVRGKKGQAYYEALKAAGYATDPNYVANLMRFYQQLGCK